MNNNYTQRIEKPNAGQVLTASYLDRVIESIFRRIIVGPGLLKRRVGQNIIIDQKAFGRGVASYGLRVETVEELPAVPSNGWEIVYWTSEGAGTGDDQWWVAAKGDTEYAPMWRVSSLSGVPT